MSDFQGEPYVQRKRIVYEDTVLGREKEREGKRRKEKEREGKRRKEKKK